MLLNITFFRNLSSLKGELIPHLVRHQRQSLAHPARKGRVQTQKLQIFNDFFTQAMQSAAGAYTDEVEEKAYRMSSHAGSEQWGCETIRCHAFVVEDQLCTRVNTIQAFQEANRLIPHNLAEFDLQSLNSVGTSSRSKVGCNFTS